MIFRSSSAITRTRNAARREDVARSFASAEVGVGIKSVLPAPFGGLGPAEIQQVAPYYHAGYLQAEREGYDAAVPLGTLDLEVDGGRTLVDIPINARLASLDQIT
jgi:hypothetical protein